MRIIYLQILINDVHYCIMQVPVGRVGLVGDISNFSKSYSMNSEFIFVLVLTIHHDSTI